MGGERERERDLERERESLKRLLRSLAVTLFRMFI